MAQDYIYFVASLPQLNFGSEPPVSFEEFLKSCESLLTKDDFNLAQRIFNDEIGDTGSMSSVLAQLISFNRDFRNEIAYFRAERAHKDPSDHLRGQRNSSALFQEVINQANKEANLLNGQMVIDRFMWNTWEDLVANSHFELENIVVFGLQLKMLEKYHDIHSPAGEEIFKEINTPEFLEEFLYRVVK